MKQEETAAIVTTTPATPVKIEEEQKAPEQPKPTAQEDMFGDFSESTSVKEATATTAPATPVKIEEEQKAPEKPKPTTQEDMFGDFSESKSVKETPSVPLPQLQKKPQSTYEWRWANAFVGMPPKSRTSKGFGQTCLDTLFPPQKETTPFLIPPLPTTLITGEFQRCLEAHIIQSQKNSSDKASKVDAFGIPLVVSSDNLKILYTIISTKAKMNM